MAARSPARRGQLSSSVRDRMTLMTSSAPESRRLFTGTRKKSSPWLAWEKTGSDTASPIKVAWFSFQSVLISTAPFWQRLLHGRGHSIGVSPGFLRYSMRRRRGKEPPRSTKNRCGHITTAVLWKKKKEEKRKTKRSSEFLVHPQQRHLSPPGLVMGFRRCWAAPLSFDIVSITQRDWEVLNKV